MSAAGIRTAQAFCGELPPMPIEPTWIVAGAPQARGKILVQSADGCLSSGLWECTAGEFRWTFAWDEFVYVLEGEVVVREENGPRHVLAPGDFAHFPRGLVSLWTVPFRVKKAFTLRTPEPLRL